ncbi:hypothetical protein PGQ11_003395 [Apiospora arundinis]|uniref:Uncharacterized protein n=1 Tax=Apiospora arundinis TaxID=335852 RepID=A0ABR2J518_9PEZI
MRHTTLPRGREEGGGAMIALSGSANRKSEGETDGWKFYLIWDIIFSHTTQVLRLSGCYCGILSGLSPAFRAAGSVMRTNASTPFYLALSRSTSSDLTFDVCWKTEEKKQKKQKNMQRK